MPKFLLPAACLALLGAPALAEAPRVVTDIPVTGSLVAQVMGDLGRPEILLPSGGNAHDYQLRPSQARSLQGADLVIWVGPGLAPWMARATKSLGNGAESVELLALPGTFLIETDDTPNHDDHDHHHDHDHDHGPHDPHAWLNPDNAKIWLEAIADSLAAQDPENTAIYRANAAEAATNITALDATLKAQLAPLSGKKFVVQHDAYRYFTRHFGLEDALPVTLSDATSPSASRLRMIQSDLTSQNVICAFPERNHDDRLIGAAIEGSKVKLGAALDPEGSSLSPGLQLYADTLQGIATGLRECLTE